MNKQNYTFEQWCLDNNRQDLLNRWDYDKNINAPSEIYCSSTKQYWFKCENNIHDSELHKIHSININKNPLFRCKQCRSFAHYVISEYGIDYLNNIWNSNNTISPYDYNKTARVEGLFNCENNSNHVYSLGLNYFSVGQRCPYCSGKRVLKDESVGVLYPDSLIFWSDKNDKTPYDYLPNSSQSVWWKCPDGKHEDFSRIIQNSIRYNFKCYDCTKEEKREKGSFNRQDMIGKVFGHLTVIDYAFTENNRAYWNCECDCGENNVIYSTCDLTSGKIVTCGNRTIHWSKENSTNWKGGITPDLLKIRGSNEYTQWRKTIFKKDNYTCQCCGTKGGDLNAHHIHDFANYENERFDIENGITLCAPCHSLKYSSSLHIMYGNIGVTEKQLEEYINYKRKILGIYIPFSIEDYKNGNILTKNYMDKCDIYYFPYREAQFKNLKFKNFIKVKPKYRIKEEC